MKIVKVKCEDLFTEEIVEKTLYFHLTEAELVSLNLSENKRYSDYKNTDSKEVGKNEIELFEKLIEKAYGQRTDDGRFIKDEVDRKAFLCSPEYSALLTMLTNGELNLQEFIISMFPKDISKKIKFDDKGNISLVEN